jgi:SAM-dependent methyltransferase
MPDEKTIASFYPDEYNPYQEVKYKPPGRISKAALNIVYGYKQFKINFVTAFLGYFYAKTFYADQPPYREGKKALDIGCGNGKFIQKLNWLGWKAEGVEFNDVAVEVARSSGATIFHGDLFTAAFPDNHFDLISARHVIEHVPDPDKFVAEISRILKPGGYFYVRTPNSSALGTYLFGNKWFPYDVPRHLFLFNHKNLALLAGQNGLQKLKTATYCSPKSFLNSLDYLTNNKSKPSRKNSLRRLVAKIFFVFPARLLNKGYELFAIYGKPEK